jgi:hypothetical protein
MELSVEYVRLERSLRRLAEGIPLRRMEGLGACLGFVLETELPAPEARQLAWLIGAVIEAWVAE